MFWLGDQADDFAVLHFHGECRSSDKNLGNKNSVAECASACKNENGCKYFVYGTGVKDGKCYWDVAYKVKITKYIEYEFYTSI